ncbi:MAG: prepilin-type N-terminal cleavage/methylation domain-containing protein [Planctomycetaceae bacterium]|nr:prepilin-type N-terminal cleavage/methylation domain-containing protein [Planctomycetaceae bacterium]
MPVYESSLPPAFRERKRWNRLVGTGNVGAGQAVGSARGGFSLPELLIVLAILTTMTAFALPSMRGPLDKSRLRSSATSVKAAIAKARATAIRRGCDVLFRYQPGTDRWWLECSGTPFGSSATLTTDGALDERITGTESSPGNKLEVIHEGQLPTGCWFIEPVMAEVTRANSGLLPDAQADSVPGLVENAPIGSDREMEPIRFRPNGRSRDAEIQIGGSRNFAVKVNVRGLTGSISYTAPFRLPSIDQQDVVREGAI